MSIGIKENKSVSGLLSFLNGGPIIFDIGSNKGDWTDIALDWYKGDCILHLFEPNLKLLSFTEIKYEYQKNVHYNGIAAYKEDTELDFHYFENYNNELSSIYKGDDWADLPMKTRKVKAIKIDTYCKKNNIKYIDYKDVEIIKKFLNPHGRMISRKKSGVFSNYRIFI